MKYVLAGAFCFLLSWCNALGQSQTDSIITTKGAVTLITCGSAITTFQIGDGKNADYDYRIVDGNVVFIRPVVANPRPTNLVIREGDNIHYMILAFRERAELSRLKYTLSASGSAKNTGSTGTGAGSSGGTAATTGDSNEAEETAQEDPAVAAGIDTVTVGNIAEDFRKQRKGGHQYETTADGITLTYSQAMSLNNLVYFSYHVRNRSGEPFVISKVSLMHKTKQDTASLFTMPVLYRKGTEAIAGKADEGIVFVAAARDFKKNDEIILVMYNKANKNQIVLYTPVSALPKYMISK
ncbi:hypothetical protein [Chitinophaga pinensis]|uniref:DUF4138 domain-containing protein n=1 Tax=Chitinophaga pinensis (strain ATCC 43595 / DSM 2588 / LMG 13176 / NBRC 15968 / NCIMB 11800 / UQM 2034) TaxID=485918 RepID=A0A979GT10_CHIPD|nr:hypothetical protein [Chitinophaga pinensis]ACU59794.1 hypothetical protein Cpin_2303 [Chitinophaga pinensis DSM 2588]